MKITDQQMHGTAATSQGQDSAESASSALSALVRQVTLSKATNLARAGRYTEAESLLSEIASGEATSPAVMDLFARIHAQQGRLLEAEAFWTRASQIDPGNEAYKAALRRISKTHGRPKWLSSILHVIVWLGVALIVVAVGFRVKNAINDFRASLSAEFAKISAEQKAMMVLLVPQEKPPDVKIDVPGVSLRAEAKEIVITFESGLFLHGDDLKPDAKAMLTTLGKQLEAHTGQIHIDIVGHTDDVPVPPGWRYDDNIDLGMHRAVAVVNHLRMTTHFPSGAFSVRSLGESLTPFPNDTDANRARNRTVVIHIYRDKK